MDNKKDECNISFLLEDFVIDELHDNDDVLKKLLEDFEKEEIKEVEENINYDFFNFDEENETEKCSYYEKKNIYDGNDELYYDREYTVKDLMKICNYYGISKNIKASKCKKTDIIATIIYFEHCDENIIIVKKRHKMWAYITELFEDQRMKCYLLW